jgi:mannose-6-phosphate isomerase-like protein (cupin superfamily)
METVKKPLPYGVDCYLEWIKKEGVPITEGIALNLFQVDTGDWPRYGVKGAATHFTGRGDYCSMFLFEISAGRSSSPIRHLFEAVYYVLEGRGSTQLEFSDGRKRQFEWGPRSFFAIPLNAQYRHFNASGQERALMCCTTTAPLMLKLFHNDEFVFGTPFEFTERIGRDDFYSGEGELHMIRPGNNTWETNFVPDLNAIELTEWEDRGKGSSNIMFALADSNMHAHISEIAPATYKKAHRHGAGTHVLTLTGDGYSLLWYPGDKDFQRVDWEYGVVFPPCDQQFHQHFVTSNHPSRYVAVGVGGARYPLLEAHRRQGIGKPGQKQAVSLSVKEGGDQIEYEDQDPRIHQIWLDEMRKRGITPKLEFPVKAAS